MNKAKKIAAVILALAFAASVGTLSAFAGRHHRYYTAQTQTGAAYVCPYGYEACAQNGACLTDGTCPYGAPRNGAGYGAGRGAGFYGAGRGCCRL